MQKLVQDSEFSNFEFWRSPIPNVEGKEKPDTEGSKVVDKEGATTAGEHYINVLYITKLSILLEKTGLF